ncbi:MAG: biopolymer transporter ExbD [Dysgonamonadaceae bacterium]|jgi:biopolymer transport protein ExbD|nr:biopolymer transporter ExbD [Dysgonamonadaceae bacterium]
MALKKRKKISAEFSMASMTDMIFLLLIFFMITSTVVVPNAIKVVLPQSAQQTSAKPLTRVTIDAGGNYFVAYGREKERPVSFDEITPFLQECYRLEPDIYVALYADEAIPYKEVVKVLDIANRNDFRMILVTRPQ